MKVNFLGATRRVGKAKVSGKDYDMSMLFYATPVQPSANANNTFMGYGHESREMELDPQALDQFAGIQLGQLVDVIVEPKPQNPRFTWVVGVQK